MSLHTQVGALSSDPVLLFSGSRGSRLTWIWVSSISRGYIQFLLFYFSVITIIYTFLFVAIFRFLSKFPSKLVLKVVVSLSKILVYITLLSSTPSQGLLFISSNYISLYPLHSVRLIPLISVDIHFSLQGSVAFRRLPSICSCCHYHCVYLYFWPWSVTGGTASNYSELVKSSTPVVPQASSFKSRVYIYIFNHKNSLITL